MSRLGLVLLLCGPLGLAACSERVIVRAAPDMLVTVEAIKMGEPIATAQVHYLFAKPTPIAEGDQALVSRMSYEAVFDCSKNAWAYSSQALSFADGTSISQSVPRPVPEVATPGSLGENIVQAVCSPGFRKEHATRRMRVNLEKDYLEAAATGV